jgi:hypothetical protein
MGAARAAGARGILVPTGRTRPEEVAAAPEVARDLLEAVDLALAGPAPEPAPAPGAAAPLPAGRATSPQAVRAAVVA